MSTAHPNKASQKAHASAQLGEAVGKAAGEAAGDSGTIVIASALVAATVPTTATPIATSSTIQPSPSAPATVIAAVIPTAVAKAPTPVDDVLSAAKPGKTSRKACASVRLGEVAGEVGDSDTVVIASVSVPAAKRPKASRGRGGPTPTARASSAGRTASAGRVSNSGRASGVRRAASSQSFDVYEFPE